MFLLGCGEEAFELTLALFCVPKLCLRLTQRRPLIVPAAASLVLLEGVPTRCLEGVEAAAFSEGFLEASGLPAMSGPRVRQRPPAKMRLPGRCALLLVFGLQWLGTAILRAGGLKALHEEDVVFVGFQAIISISSS